MVFLQNWVKCSFNLRGRLVVTSLDAYSRLVLGNKKAEDFELEVQNI